MPNYTEHDKVLEMLKASQEADTDNRDSGREAHLFVDKRDGQWEPHWWNASQGRPRYTFDMTGPIVDVVSGELEQADFNITINPAGGDVTKDDAQLLDGIVRNIENISGATDIFNLAARNMITAGVDGWMVKQKYIDDNSFDQDLVIEPIANFIDSVWFGPFKKADASDMKYCIVLEAVSKAEYDERYPEGSGQSVGDNKMSQAYYFKEDQVILGNIFYIDEEPRELLLMSNGHVLEADEAEPILDELEMQGVTVKETRKRNKNIVKSRLFDGSDWLNDEQETVFNQIPVIPTFGNFKVFENKIIYRGVVEKLLDSQRVFNYAKSREIEEGALAPRAKYWLTEKQSEGHEDTLATLNTNADPVQHFNADPENPGVPQQSGGAAVNPGLQTISNDMRTVVQQTAGLFAASMGDNPGLQSGVAIEKLQNKGDTGTIKYFKAQERAIARTARIIIDAIPKVYSSERQIRILKEDGSFDITTVNQPVFDQQTQRMVTVNDLSKGKYDVICSAGPSFQNKQQETVQAITEIAAVDPSAIQMGSDILFNNITSPGMDLLAERKRAQLIQGGIIPMGQLTDDEKAELQQQQAAQGQQPDPAMVLAQAEQAKADANMAAQQIKQQQVQLEAQKLGLDQQRLQLDAQDKAEKANLELQKLMLENKKLEAAANKQEAEVVNITANTAKTMQEIKNLSVDELLKLSETITSEVEIRGTNNTE